MAELLNSDISDIEIMLMVEGPLLSSTIIQSLIKDYGVKPAAARKRLERAKKSRVVEVTRQIFKNNQRVYYLPHQVERANEITRALRADIESRKKKLICESNDQIISFYASQRVREWYATLEYGSRSANINKILERSIRGQYGGKM